MNVITRRVAAGFALVAAPALIALGAAGVSNAQTTNPNQGTAGTHRVFPQQQNFPQPGTSVHHHHQSHR